MPIFSTSFSSCRSSRLNKSNISPLAKKLTISSRRNGYFSNCLAVRKSMESLQKQPVLLRSCRKSLLHISLSYRDPDGIEWKSIPAMMAAILEIVALPSPPLPPRTACPPGIFKAWVTWEISSRVYLVVTFRTLVHCFGCACASYCFD